MGLDMYLTGKRYISAYGDDAELRAKLKPLVEDITHGFDVKEISFEVFYWRKCNAIHRWFVDNVQDGEDDCKQYYVHRDSLKELLDTITKVLDNPDLVDELLPPTEGFFFGSTDIDEWYWADLKVTKETLESVLDKFAGDYGTDFYYRASW